MQLNAPRLSSRKTLRTVRAKDTAQCSCNALRAAAGQALKLKGRLLPPKKLLARIASIYARKILLDQTDDRNGR